MSRKLVKISMLTLCIAQLAACGGSSSSGSLIAGTDTDTETETETETDTGDLSEWIVNTTERSTQIFESSSSLGVLQDVQSVSVETVDGSEYVYVQATGIPKYDITMTQDMVDELNSRPRASSDFYSGYTTATAGQLVEFGEDIGYISSTDNCDSTGGAGYWPPGPVCPTDTAKQVYITKNPQPNSGECDNGLGITGLLVNGTSVFGWGDGMSYNNQGVWYNLAPVAEQYDVDFCGGHAANNEYHHHFYTSCLADLVGDDGSAHSPLYGYAADGYPIYGPYEGAGELAVSGWKTRDYGAPVSEGGCGTPGERSCVLIDEYDISQGVDSTVSAGPDVDQSVTTMSGNPLLASDGYFYQDYYYAGIAASGSQLDQYNGHDNSDGRGYHYHITLQDVSGKLTPSFPYTIGPRFYGELPANAASSCDTGGGTMGPPPGAGGPPSFL